MIICSFVFHSLIEKIRFNDIPTNSNLSTSLCFLIAHHNILLQIYDFGVFQEVSRVAKNISLAPVLPISSGTSCHLSLNVVFALIKTVFLLFTMYSKTPGETKSTNLPRPLLTNSCLPILP